MNLKNLTKLFIISILISGCASLAPKDSEYTWVRSNRPVLPYEVKVIPEYTPEIRKLCGHGNLIWACALFYVEDTEAEVWVYTHCIIYTTNKNLPQFILEHEKKHCEGWDHIEK